MRPPGVRSACPYAAQVPFRFLPGNVQRTLIEHPSNTQEAPGVGRASKARAPTRPIVYVAELFPGFQHPTFQNKKRAPAAPKPTRVLFTCPLQHPWNQGKSPTGTT